MSNALKYKKITTLAQYNKYCDIHEKYGLENPEQAKDEIELLEILIDEYDSRTKSYKKELNPVELLRSILNEENINNSELAKAIGTSRQLISDILRYKRSISKAMVLKLSQQFKMRAEAFNRPYKLKKPKE